MGDLFVLLLVVGLAAGFRVIAGRLDRNRICEYIEIRGGRVLEITWAPFGPGWFGSGRERIYDVAYETIMEKFITGRAKPECSAEFIGARTRRIQACGKTRIQTTQPAKRLFA